MDAEFLLILTSQYCQIPFRPILFSDKTLFLFWSSCLDCFKHVFTDFIFFQPTLFNPWKHSISLLVASGLWFLYCVNQASTSAILIKSNAIMVTSDSERSLRMYFYLVPNMGPVVVSWTMAWASSEKKTYHHWNVLQSPTQSYLPLGGNGVTPFSLRFAATKLLSTVLVPRDGCAQLHDNSSLKPKLIVFLPCGHKGPCTENDPTLGVMHCSCPEVLHNCWTQATSFSFRSRPANYVLGLIHSTLSFLEAGAV